MKRWLFLCLLSFLLVGRVQAASLFFATPKGDFVPGDRVPIAIVFNGDGVSANAVEGKLVYDRSAFRLESVTTANSIVSLWLHDPSSDVADDGEIDFSGLSPNGFPEFLGSSADDSIPGTVFMATFTALASTSTSVELQGVQVLGNDGRGTELATKTLPLQVKILPGEATAPALEATVDKMPPENFAPLLGRDQALFDGAWFVAFHAIDKDSGIARYEVKQGLARYKTATTPFALGSSPRFVPVWVRAIDHAGNARVVHVPATGIFSLWLLICGIVLLVSIGGALWRRGR